MTCDHCGRQLLGDGIPSTHAWCGEECMTAWEREHPEEADGWVRVEDLTVMQRAELDALIGRGKAC